MPKICHIEITPATGMPRVLREGTAARNAGYEVEIIGEGEDSTVSGLLYHGFPPASSRFHRAFVRSRRMVDKAVETGADIVQLHSPELLLYAFRLKRRGVKVIFDCHEYYTAQIRRKGYIPRRLRGLAAGMYSRFERFVCRRIDALLYPGTQNGSGAYFENRSKRVLKIENYPMFRDIEPAAPGEARSAVIYAGGLTADRGITNLAKAVEMTEGAALVLCGPFFSEEYQAEIQSYCSPGKLDYKGTLMPDELFSEYRKSAAGACVLLPVGQYAAVDNLATKICEYMQCGLPVVMSNFHCNAYWNERYHFGLCVDPENVEEIAAAISYLLDNPEEARRMGENGRRAVKEAFNWEVEAEKLLALYGEILKD